MQIFVSAAGELSIYRQIMRQITEAIAVGRLKSGDRLPSQLWEEHASLLERLAAAK